MKSVVTLDLNSQYLYLLQTTHFQNTCSVTIYNEKIVGFFSGYIIPNDKDTLFIWQVAVSNEIRGQNLAMKIILDIFNKNKY
ncbi:GNAT family N-acetyltransferase [Arcobacter sp.]|uniref:GNAT family N-acetyltransferase n=1 Tax=Arcobacter sp. TaxID=1872629 RepID=UPI00338EA82F